MKINDRRVLVCNCEGTMDIDADKLAKACGASGGLTIASALCRAQIETFVDAAGDGKVLVACTQEAPMFLETNDDLGDKAADLKFTNIRERAGWSAARGKALTAKMAALLAEATLDIPGANSVTMISGGSLLILGSDDAAITAAQSVASRLDVSVIISGRSDLMPPKIMDVPVFRGDVASASGHLGSFELKMENYAPASPASRGFLEFAASGQSGAAICDLILDLRGGTPLFPAPEKRDGYFNPDPKNPALVQKALLELTDMVGEFEKPRYIDYKSNLCAHSRSGIVGCTRCIDHCPTSAITSSGDSVKIDPYICAGCGTCASLCPTGAAKYELPAGDAIFARLRTLLGTYTRAGGDKPALLVHDATWGDEMISTIARFGGGLPANVIPFAVNAVSQIGLEFYLAAAGYGAGQIALLLAPAQADEKAALQGEMELAELVFEGLGYGRGRTLIIDEQDPGRVESLLAALPADDKMPHGDFMAMGRKRAVMALALNQLHESAPRPVDQIDLPAGAPFGAVAVDVDGCTLCLACVGACPTGALKDNPDLPQLSFSENACVQCGLCKNTCPEKVISLTPRLSFAEFARSHQTIKEEEPFECIRCSKPFGTKSTINSMIEKLDGHPMFADAKAMDRLKMCDDCRIIAMTEVGDNPMALGKVPVTRTTDDYLREREELRRSAAKDMMAKGLLPPEGEA
ncbi:MAG: 4Fe-4S binding protein [Rhodospirillales bacterium]|nr:4Fe-4S binding protein [Rhodospirillales bacterium]